MNADDPNEPTPGDGPTPGDQAGRPIDGGVAEPRNGMPTAVKVLLWTLVIAVAIVILFGWVFPWVESMQQDPTLGV